MGLKYTTFEAVDKKAKLNDIYFYLM